MLIFIDLNRVYYLAIDKHNSLSKTAELIKEIYVASQEQDIGADRINISIQDLGVMVQMDAASSEEVAATAEELSIKTAALQTTMTFFKV